MKKETIAIIISFVLLAGIIAVGILNSKGNTFSKPQKEPQAGQRGEVVILDEELLTETSLRHFDITNWLTYKGEENFSFKYPPNNGRVEKGEIYYGPSCFPPNGKVLEGCGNMNLKARYHIVDIHRQASYYGASFTLNVWENNEKLSLLDWIKHEKVINQTYPYICLSLSINDTVDGLACQDAWLDPLPGGAIFYDFYLGHKDFIYIFSLFEMGCSTSDSNCDFLKQQQIYETIVSTFSIE